MQTAKDEAFGIIPVILASSGSDHQFLLILHNKGHWGFPKGHKDAGESDLETARRELREETGLETYTLLDIQLSENYQFFSPEGVRINKTVVYFVASVSLTAMGDPPTITIQPEELSDYRWCTLADGLKLIPFEEGQRLLQRCHQQLPQR